MFSFLGMRRIWCLLLMMLLCWSNAILNSLCFLAPLILNKHYSQTGKGEFKYIKKKIHTERFVVVELCFGF